MTKKRRTRRALINSVISLIICFSMLLGTTFAWFTDSVSSVNNIIKAGNLDVEVYYVNDEGEPTSIKDVNTLFNDVKLWEPGVVAYENLTVANLGTLALKYQLSINFVNENTVDGHGLSDILQVAVVEGGVDTTKYTNDDAGRKALVDSIATWKSMNSFTKDGKLLPVGSDLKVDGIYDADGSIDTDTYGIVIYWKPSNNDNNWNVNNGKQVSDYVNEENNYLHIDLGVNLVATQLVAEYDSFGRDYDHDAEYLPEWDGKATEVPEEVDNTITITTAGELAALAEAVNAGTSYSGKTILLGADLNLSNKNWTPIGACDSETYFQGTFDGNGHTIYNLNVDKSIDTYKNSTAGLFGWIDAAGATIKNVNLDGATVKGSHWVGALVGYMTGDVVNCTVTDSIVIGYNVNSEANGDKVGGLVGYMNSGAGQLTGNTVSKTTVSGYRDVAGLAGAVATSNSVKNNNVVDSVVIYEADHAAKIVSKKTDVVVDETNSAQNVVLQKVVSVGDEKALRDNVAAGNSVKLGADITVSGYNADQKLVINAPIVLDLNGKTLTTECGWGGIDAKGGCTIINGTINHISNTAAIKAFDVNSIENVTIRVTPGDADKIVTGIAVQSGGHVSTIKNVTITGASQGIEVFKGAKVDFIENANVQAVSNGSKPGTALQINAGNVGKAVNSSFDGEVYGVHMMLNGEYTVALELDNCVVTGDTAGIYAHDEADIPNTTNCFLTLAYDEDTVINGDFVWSFEDECQSVVTLNKPSGN